MYAATVETMTKKARFEPDVAMAVAEAFDIAIGHAQLVTVPMMDARFTGMDARFTGVDARFKVVDTRIATLEAKMDARFQQVDARFEALELKMDTRFKESDSRMDARFALQDERMDKKLEALKSELVRWVFVAVLGNTALAAAVNALSGLLQHFR